MCSRLNLFSVGRPKVANLQLAVGHLARKQLDVHDEHFQGLLEFLNSFTLKSSLGTDAAVKKFADSVRATVMQLVPTVVFPASRPDILDKCLETVSAAPFAAPFFAENHPFFEEEFAEGSTNDLDRMQAPTSVIFERPRPGVVGRISGRTSIHIPPPSGLLVHSEHACCEASMPDGNSLRCWPMPAKPCCTRADWPR